MGPDYRGNSKPRYGYFLPRPHHVHRSDLGNPVGHIKDFAMKKEKLKKNDFVGLRVDPALMEKLFREKQRIEAELNKIVTFSYVVREVLNRLP